MCGLGNPHRCISTTKASSPIMLTLLLHVLGGRKKTPRGFVLCSNGTFLRAISNLRWGFEGECSTGKWRHVASGRPGPGGQGWAGSHRRAVPAMQRPGVAPHLLYAAPRTFTLLNVLALVSELEQRGNIIEGHA